MSRDTKSLHYHDPFRVRIKGLDKLVSSKYGGEFLALEFKDLTSIFEPYSEEMMNNLEISHEDEFIQDLLDGILFDRGNYKYHDINYGFVHRLMHLLGHMHSENALFSNSYAEILWKDTQITQNKTMIIPTDLILIPGETMKKKRNGSFIQSYSIPTRLGLYDRYKYKTTHFDKMEILHFTWPYGYNDISFKLKSLINSRSKYYKLELQRAEATASGYKGFTLINATRLNSTLLRRDFQVSLLKIRKILHLGIYADGFVPTKEYDAYLLYKYYLNKAYALEHYLSLFNQQFMTYFAKKNSLHTNPFLLYTGKYSSVKIRELYAAFKHGSIPYSEFVERLTSNPS